MIGNRINTIFELLKIKNIVKTKKNFCELLGIDYTNLSRYIDGKVSFTINAENYEKFRQAGINIDWLLTGDGEPFLKDEKAKEPEKSVLVQEIEKIAEQVTYLKMENRLASVETKQEELESLYKELYELYHNTQTDKSPEEVKEPASTYEMEEETVDLPLAVSLAAGLPIEAFDTGDTYPVPKSFLKKNEKYCVARICGTSMTELGIVDGSVVLVRHTSEVKNGAICVVRYGENTTLKKLERTDAGDWVLRYCDGSGAIIPLVEGDWEVKGEFVAVVGKKDKTQ